MVYLSLASMKDSYVSSNVGKLFIQDLVSYIGTLYTRQSTFKMVYLYVDETYSVIYEGLWIFEQNARRGLTSGAWASDNGGH